MAKKVTLKKISKKALKKKPASSAKKKSTSAPKTKQKTKKSDSKDLINAIYEGMSEKKASEIKWLDLTKIPNCSFEHFIICHADNKIQVNAIADSIEEVVSKKIGLKPSHTEGRENGEWIILDYIDVVAHVFLGEFRYHYNLEGFWGDARIKNLT
ncbi:MAG: ribosome silencing factor [Bacteroidia bacterium]|nr:ribosome silencing factor [Bacteroidia bacterium]